MTVSEKDRDYFRRLGEWKAANHAEALREHLAKPPIERIASSFELWRRWVDPTHAADRDDDPTPLFDRARELGCYRP